MGAGVGVIRTLRTAAIATALLLAAGHAWALGLGQIEVKSRRNQPLVAEIPIISTTPGELEALKARLASPDTFRRVGLAPPSGAAADLQFSLGSDARGRPVIRVTTTRPVETSVLNFLVEVDWGQGRLVREYSALVEAPNTASAPLQPAIEAPLAPAPNVVQRPVAPPVAAAPVPASPPVADARPEPEPAPSAIAIAPLPPAQPPAQPPAPVSAPLAAASAPAQYGPIKQGETLSKIAGKLDLPSGFSLDQTMLALLRANPDAFLGDDINRLRRGSVLRVPGSDELGSVSADEAGQVVRQQMQQWRQARRPVRQPEVATAATPAATATRAPKPVAREATAAPKPIATAATPPKPQAAPPRRQEARLQIIPPAAPGKATGTRSGTVAGGEGSMLQQQLRQRDEDIAAKAAEIGDLKERVAELEKLKQEQQQLLSLKDSELAAAQQRLAESNRAAAAAAKPMTAQAATQVASQASEQVSTRQDEVANATSPMPYIWGGLGLAALALLAWLLFGRRKPVPAPRRSSFDSEALAASLVHPSAGSDAVSSSDPEPEVGSVEPPASSPVPNPVPPAAEAAERPAPMIDLADVPPTATRVEAPTWHSGWMKADAVVPPVAPVPAYEPAAPRFVPVDDGLPDLVPTPQASAEQRMKLARAFLDIGDDHSAKQLLQELLDDPDPVARADAGRLLREIG